MTPESSVSSRRPALAGAVAVAAAFGMAELLTGLLSVGLSVVVAVGNLIIDISPESVVRFGIRVFGFYDKPVLIAGIVVVGIIAGGALGRLAVKKMTLAVLGFLIGGSIGTIAVLQDPLTSGPTGLVAVWGAVATGILALRLLFRTVEPAEQDEGRRRFLLSLAGVTAFAAITAATGRVLVGRMREVLAGREDVILPRPFSSQALPVTGDALAVDGISELVTPNENFYRIDTAISVPRVDLDTWTLKITGLVDRPVELTFEDLLDLPMVERFVTLSCVSNRVGGTLVGHARWLGVPLADLLDRAGVQPEATQIVGRSVDGFTVGFPAEAASDGREALVAVAMNGEPLPFDHGFPARLVVAGLYGYVSATKWLSEIELTTWDAFDAYWIPRGWSKEAPVKTQSRIDVPRQNERLDAGTVPIAGVAWAPNRGVARVEVQVDDGPWIEAELSAELSKDSWRQWAIDWEATTGDHVIQVRATDSNGDTQTEQVTAPAPNGATGYHSRNVVVT
jgi:DMSO/TMAO reductase YedYZ molybdopterin-dependent catalytic subunit